MKIQHNYNFLLKTLLLWLLCRIVYSTKNNFVRLDWLNIYALQLSATILGLKIYNKVNLLLQYWYIWQVLPSHNIFATSNVSKLYTSCDQIVSKFWLTCKQVASKSWSCYKQTVSKLRASSWQVRSKLRVGVSKLLVFIL